MLKSATSLFLISSGITVLVLPWLCRWWEFRKTRKENLPVESVQVYLDGIRSAYWAHRCAAIKSCSKNPFLASHPKIVNAICRCAIMDPDGDVQQAAKKFMAHRPPLREVEDE